MQNVESNFSQDDLLLPSSLQVSAWGSGKLILFGEHAVVYGYPAIALALPKGLKVTIYRNGEEQKTASSFTHPEATLRLSSLGILGSLKLDEAKLLERALQVAISWSLSHGLRLKGSYLLMVEGMLPFKVGLGSSAALSVATLKALGQLKGHTWTHNELFEGAMEMEKIFHQTFLGRDTSKVVVQKKLSFLLDLMAKESSILEYALCFDIQHIQSRVLQMQKYLLCFLC